MHSTHAPLPPDSTSGGHAATDDPPRLTTVDVLYYYDEPCIMTAEAFGTLWALILVEKDDEGDPIYTAAPTHPHLVQRVSENLVPIRALFPPHAPLERWTLAWVGPDEALIAARALEPDQEKASDVTPIPTVFLRP